MRSLAVVLILVAAAGCDPSQSAIEHTFDPCEAVELDVGDATAEQRASIDDAIAMWQERGTTLVIAGHQGIAPRLTIAFGEAAEVFYGFYDPATAVIHVNTALDDRRQRAITIAHELGHAFGLLHVEREHRESVMNRGNLFTAPTSGDHREVEALWGGCVVQVTP